MDLQAYQGKDQQQQQSTTTTGALDGFSSSISTDSLMNTTMLSPYNAFYNPSQYPSSNYSAANPISQQLLPRESDVDPSSNTGATLFPFAEASNNNNSNSSNTAPPSSSYNASINPSSILSFDHLAGSENPQPIDPHLLMTGLTETSAATTTATTASSLPTVKEEEDIDPSSTFPLNNAAAAFPLSMSTRPLAATTSHTQQQRRSVSASATTNKKRRSTSAATTAAHDDSMNGIDGLSDEDPSDSEGEDEDDDEAVQAPRKRSSAAASAANKKRTSAAATSKASMNNKRVSSAAAIQSKKESSVGHHPTQQLSHPHALVPVPEWEDKLSKAEYDKLSSKEKRQMRNKISARNFRHRRKAHIDTLEALVADKDQVIAVLNEEVSTLRVSGRNKAEQVKAIRGF